MPWPPLQQIEAVDQVKLPSQTTSFEHRNQHLVGLQPKLEAFAKTTFYIG